MAEDETQSGRRVAPVDRKIPPTHLDPQTPGFHTKIAKGAKDCPPWVKVASLALVV